MKLLTDLKYRSNTLVLENFKPNPDDALVSYNFCQDAFAVPETIGGIFFTDLDQKQHWIELKNQALYTLIFTLKSMSLRLPLNIAYDDSEVPLRFCSKAFGIPEWLIYLMQHIGLMKRNLTYQDFLKQANDHPSKTVSLQVHQ